MEGSHGQTGKSLPASSEKRKNESKETEFRETTETASPVSLSVEPEKPVQRHCKIARGFSMVDPELVSNLHSDIKMKGKKGGEESYGYFQDVTRFNFTLPDFAQYDNEFVEFLMKDLIENLTLKSLEESGHLNWWTKYGKFQRLLPLATSGDGNCLLHAASLGIWGVHDRLLNLRQAVHHTLSTTLAERTIKKRWRWYQWVKNINEGELVFSEDEWENEWQLVLSLAAPKPRSSLPRQSLTTVHEGSDGDTQAVEVSVNQVPKPRRFSTSSEPRYESLEEVHIFSLAHVLRRPIVVVADTVLYDFKGDAAFTIPFGGVYLPVECDPEECCRIPLVLAYSSAHFSPLVAMEMHLSQSQVKSDSEGSDGPTVVQVVIPLVDKHLKVLPLPFAVDPGDDWDWLTMDNSEKVIKNNSLSSEKKLSLLKKYLDIVCVDLKMASADQAEGRLKKETFVGGSDTSDGKAEDVEIPVEHLVPVAELPCGNQPNYYKELIKRYVEKANERFKFEQEMNRLNPKEESRSIKCANDGCDLYGTVANNYLCSKCFQLQSKSLSQFKPKALGEQNSGVVGKPPPYAPPSYSEAAHNTPVFYPPSLSSSTNSRNTGGGAGGIPQSAPTVCLAKGCSFYGTADKHGFCSKCYKANN